MKDFFEVLNHIEDTARIVGQTEKTRLFLHPEATIPLEAQHEAEEALIHLSRVIMFLKEGRSVFDKRP